MVDAEDVGGENVGVDSQPAGKHLSLGETVRRVTCGAWL
jgi:hypothetical protein